MQRQKSKTNKKRNKPYLRVSIFIGIFVFCFIVILSPIAFVHVVRHVSTNQMCLNSINPSLADLENHTDFRFPDSATSIFYEMSVQGRDSTCTIWISFNIEEQDVDFLVEHSLVDGLVEGTIDNNIFDYEMKQKGWSQSGNSLVGITEDCIAKDYYFICQYLSVDLVKSDSIEVRIIIDKSWL